jgi:hypothetical protein
VETILAGVAMIWLTLVERSIDRAEAGRPGSL